MSLRGWRRWRDWPWSAKLTLLLAALAVAPLSAVTLASAFTARAELLDAMRSQNLQQARDTAQTIDRYLNDLVADVKALAMSPWVVRSLDGAPVPALEKDVAVALRQMRDTQGFDAVFLLDPGGRVRLSTEPRLVGRSYTARTSFLSAVAGTPSLIAPRWDPWERRAFLQASAPVRRSDGPILGVVIGRVEMARIDAIVEADKNFAGHQEYGVLWDADGIRLSHPTHPFLRFRPFEPLPQDTASRLIAERRFGPRTAELLKPPLPLHGLVARSRWLLYDRTADPYMAVDTGQQTLQVSIAPLESTRWLYGIVSTESAVLAALRQQVLRNLGLAGVIGLLSVVLGLAAAGWATRPLRLVGQTANAIAAGDMLRRVGLDQRDEVGQLAAAFDAMAEALAAKEAELRGYAGLLERRVEEQTAALRASEAELRALFAAMRDAIFIFDDRGTCLKVAPTRAMASPLVTKLRGRSLADVFPSEQAAYFVSQIRRALDTWQTVYLEYEVVVNGSGLWLEAAITPLLEGSVVWVARDVTWRKRSEGERRELLLSEQEARRKAEEANRTKDEFLSTLSHELRTPLNAILGWTWLIQNGSLDAAGTQRAVATIERNARAQSQIVDDILDVSRIITGKLRLKLRRLSLAQVVDAAIDAVRPAAEAKGIRIERVLDPDPPPVSGDPNRLQQVAWNLLSNAVKFTPAGGRIEVRLDHDGGQARLQVSDSGIGIRPDFLAYVFDRFRQADSSTTRTYGGLGLGLAIVRHLVELHGGTVQAESAGEGQGARFTVTLPFTPLRALREPEPAPGPREETVEAGDHPEIRGLRVLLVDDEADAREMLPTLLERFGAHVTVAASAREALDEICRRELDVLVADIGMPEIDGYELIRRVRALDGRGSLPAVALTAYAGEADRKRALDAGFQVHLAKPVEPHQLAAAVAAAAGWRPALDHGLTT